MFTVKRCCCMSLRNGGLVLGWLGVVASTITVCNSINQLVNYNNYEILDENDEIFVKHDGPKPRDLIVFILAASLFNLLVSGVLINGITASKHCMLLPWLIIKGLGLIIIIPMGFVLLHTASMSSEPGPMIASIFVLMLIGFFCFCWIVVYSLYEEIRTTAKKTLTFYESGVVAPYQQFGKV